MCLQIWEEGTPNQIEYVRFVNSNGFADENGEP
jgi:hypothetical protein